MRTLIIGYGNPLRGDDGVGWAVADSIQGLLDSAGGRAIACHQLTPELACAAAAADLVIFVDASYGSPAGRVNCTRVAAGGTPPAAVGHQASPEHLLDLVASMTRAGPPRAFLIAVNGESFDYGQDLSPPVRRACEEVCRRIEEIVTQEGGFAVV